MADYRLDLNRIIKGKSTPKVKGIAKKNYSHILQYI